MFKTQTSARDRRSPGRFPSLLLLAATLLITTEAVAGFIIEPPGSPVVLDGQNVDWITIQDNLAGDGIGNLFDGTANIGVEGITNAGDLSIRDGGLLDADHTDGVNQYTGTLNVGHTLGLYDGGQMILNADTVYVQGRSDTGGTGQQGTLNVFSSSQVDSIESDIQVDGSIRIQDAGTLFHQAGGNASLVFSDELSITNGAVLTSDNTGTATSGLIQASGTPGPGASSLARGDIFVAGGTMNLVGGVVDTTAGTQGLFQLNDGTLDASGTDIDAQVFDAFGSSTATIHGGADMHLTGSATIRDGSTLTVDTASQFTTDGDLRVNTGGQATIRNDITPAAVVVENLNSLLDLTNSALNADSGSVIVVDQATYNHNMGSLTTSTSFEVRDSSTADLTDVDVDVGQNFTVTDGPTGGSTYRQTGGLLDIGTNWDIFGGSGVTLTDVALTSGDFGLIHGGSSFVQSGGSISTGGRFEANNSNADLTNVDLTTGAGAGVILADGAIYTQSGGSLTSGEILQVRGAATTANLTDTHVILSSDLQVLDGASYNQTNLATGNALNVGGQLRVTGGADASLSHLDVGAESVTLENAGSTLSIVDGSLSTSGNRVYLTDNAAYTHDTGSLSSFSSLEVRDGSTAELTDVTVAVGQNMTVTDGASGGSSYVQTGGTLGVGTGWDVFGGSAMTLTDVVLTSGEQGLIQNGSIYSHTGGSLTTGGRFEVNAASASVAGVDLTTQNNSGIFVSNGGNLDITAASNVQTKDFVINGPTSSGLVDHSTLTTETLELLNDAIWTEINSTINVTGNTTTVSGGSTLSLDGGTFNEAGDLILDGTLSGTDPILNIGSDLTVGGTGRITFSEAASISVGDDFLVDPLASGLLDLSSTTVSMLGLRDDDADGFLFGVGSLVDTLIVEGIDLILQGDLVVSSFLLDPAGLIDLNGHMLTVSDSFVGNIGQITDSSGGGSYSLPVPAPAPIFLIGTGAAALLRRDRRKLPTSQ